MWWQDWSTLHNPPVDLWLRHPAKAARPTQADERPKEPETLDRELRAQPLVCESEVGDCRSHLLDFNAKIPRLVEGFHVDQGSPYHSAFGLPSLEKISGSAP
jgi:hypothetical protein